MTNGAERPRIFGAGPVPQLVGLLLPSNIERVPAEPPSRIARELLPEPEPVAIVHDAADINANIGVFVDEAAVGMRPTKLTELRRVLGDVPFEPGCWALRRRRARWPHWRRSRRATGARPRAVQR